ncbi:MAG: DUF485 domain-containing protein [Nitrospiraceae bacterium]|nr:DUF485 domain-containing protein [Nitrospiraceae bacterium]
MGKSKLDILNDKDFREMAGRKNSISIILTILELIIYFGFVFLIAFDKPFLATKLSAGGATTIGIPIGVGVILLSWILTGIYIRWANNKYDVMVEKIKEKIGG